MVARVGYKHTEVGVIPEDWDVSQLSEIVNFTNGKPHEHNVSTNGRYSLITLDSVGINGQLKSTHKRTNVLDDSLRKGDIVAVLSDIAHGNLLGLCDVIPEDGMYVLNQRMGRLRVRGGASPEFLRLSINLNQAHFKRRGQGTSQRHVYKRDFDSLLLPLPHPAEQSVIAEALSDVDSLIESLDLLIAKKRDIKQGATQQLLSGNTRLPGFSSDWTIKTMRSLGSTYGGLSGKTADDFGAGSALFIPFTNVMKNVAVDLAQLEPVSIKFGENQNQVFAGDVLFNGSSETPEEVGLATVVPVGTQTLYLNSFCFGFRLNLDVPTSGLYLAYFFRSQLGRAIVYSLAQGSTRYNISKVALLNQSLRLPSLREQLDIAAVLTDMDTEIETLAARREKTIQVKEGMMSELLTGRTRLL